MAPKDTLSIGQNLVIWQNSKSGAVVRKVHYEVRNGDSLSTIAYKFKVKTQDIKKWNKIGKYIKPKQKLTLYVNIADYGQ